MTIRQGIHKRWGKKFLVRQLEGNLVLSPERAIASAKSDQRNLDEMAVYADGGTLANAWGVVLHGPPSFQTQLNGLRLLRNAAYAAFSSVDADRSALGIGVLFELRSVQLHVARNIAMTRNQEPANRHGGFDIAGRCLLTSTGLGWLGPAKKLAEAIVDLIPLEAFGDADPGASPKHEPSRLPLQWFALRLIADWAGLSLPDKLPRHPYPTPELDAVLAAWRNPDPAALIEPLLATCDWHTHECMYSQSMRPSKQVAFISEPYMGWPVEIHAVFRLRDSLGLANPLDLDHPLMKTPLATYTAEPWPVPHDDLLERVTARALKDYPELAELL